MTRIWCGQPPSDPEMCGSDPEMHGRPCQLVNLPRQPDYACKLHRCSPRFQYCVNFVAQIAFLILYSYGLLFNFDQDITYVFISLIIWVAAVSVEELRQLLSKDSVLRDSSLEISKNTQTRVRAYFSQGWNWIDLVTIVLFWLGMVVFAPVYELQVFGRILLSIDVFFFFMRMFQMLMVFDELGLMLVMIYKMVKDTRNFMIILLVFVLAYAVASESLLYPESHVTGYRLFHLPRKAYWQVFGELMLDEIEIRDQDSCSVNDSMHLGSDDPHCPSKFGTYVVPILLGFHIMITNVLLLNLLIARFGVTFNKVHDEACEYQSWHRCQIITEYYSRTSLPPPLNLLHLVFYFLQFCCIKICQLCCCCRRKKQPENGGMELTSRRKEDRRCSHDSLGHSVSDVNQPLVNEGTVQAKLSADKRSVELTWDSSYDGWRHDDSRQQIYVVAINVSRDQQTPPAPDQFHIARKGGSQPQAFTIWNLDPQSKYIITVGDELVHQGRVDSSINAEHLQSTLEFEKEQAVRVCRSENTSSWSKELHSQMEIIGQEIGKITGGIKENHDALMKKMSSNTEGLKKVTKHSNENRDAFQKIDGNVEKLLKFLESNMKSMTDKTNKAKEKEKKAEKKRIEAEEKKEKAENKLKNAKAELERLQSEKEMMKNQAAPLEALQQKQQLMEQQQEQIHQILSQMQREQQQQQQQQVQQVLSQMQQEQQQQQLEQVQQTLTLIQQQQQQQQEQVQQTLMQIQEQQQLQVQQMLQVMQAVRSSAEGSHDANTQ